MLIVLIGIVVACIIAVLIYIVVTVIKLQSSVDKQKNDINKLIKYLVYFDTLLDRLNYLTNKTSSDLDDNIKKVIADISNGENSPEKIVEQLNIINKKLNMYDNKFVTVDERFMTVPQYLIDLKEFRTLDPILKEKYRIYIGEKLMTGIVSTINSKRDSSEFTNESIDQQVKRLLDLTNNSVNNLGNNISSTYPNTNINTNIIV